MIYEGFPFDPYLAIIKGWDFITITFAFNRGLPFYFRVLKSWFMINDFFRHFIKRKCNSELLSFVDKNVDRQIGHINSVITAS